MVVIMKPDFTAEQLQTTIEAMEAGGVKVMVSKGVETTILGAEGDASGLDQEYLSQLAGVERVMRVSEPYKKANRKYHPDDSVIDMGCGVQIGGKKLVVIAGPCSVESESQVVGVAQAVQAAGATALRGGAYKPRTSPYSFQGKGVEGIRLLLEAKHITGLPIVTELMSAEYIMSEGNPNVILCERGIRTFETFTRNTLDLSAVLAVKKLSHLPVVVDPSHACGQAWMVERMAMAAIAAGADGLIIEVHNDPPHALCDGAQSVTPEQFSSLMDRVRTIAACVDRAV